MLSAGWIKSMLLCCKRIVCSRGMFNATDLKQGIPQSTKFPDRNTVMVNLDLMIADPLVCVLTNGNAI